MRLSTREAARYLGVGASTLEHWRCQGGGPRFHRLSARRVVYDTAELDRFLASTLRASTSEEAPPAEPAPARAAARGRRR